MTQERPKVGLGVYILNEKQELLLLRRKGAHGENTWCAPGGHLEFGESFEECVKREAKEECDLDIEDSRVVTVTNDIFLEEGKHYITIGMRAESYTGEPKIMEPEKCDKMGWFPLNALPEPLFISAKNYFDSNPECLCGSGVSFNKCHGK